MKLENISSRRQYPIIAIVFVLLSIIAFLSTSEFSFLVWLGFPLATGLAILFAYESAKSKNPTAKIIGKICLFVSIILVLLTVLAFISDWNLFWINKF